MALTQVKSDGIATGAVTATQIAANAVTVDDIADGSISTAKLADDSVTADKLADTAVTAGSYGSASAIPAITVDAQGRITAASTNAISVESDRIFEGNTSAEAVDTGSDGHFKVVTEGTEAMRIDSSQRVGIGTTSPGSADANGDNLVIGNWSGYNGLTITAGTTGDSSVYFSDGTTGDQRYRGWIDYQHANDALRLGTSGTERVRITSNGTLQLRNSPGIDFSQIQTNASGMTSETLDSYEEGYWTPTLTGFDDNAGGSPTYEKRAGRYTKIGNLVYCDIYIQWTTAYGTGSIIQLQGLPFAVDDIEYGSPSTAWTRGNGSPSYNSISPGEILTFYGSAGNTFATIYKNGDVGYTVSDGTNVSSKYFIATFTYNG